MSVRLKGNRVAPQRSYPQTLSRFLRHEKPSGKLSHGEGTTILTLATRSTPANPMFRAEVTKHTVNEVPNASRSERMNVVLAHLTCGSPSQKFPLLLSIHTRT